MVTHIIITILTAAAIFFYGYSKGKHRTKNDIESSFDENDKPETVLRDVKYTVDMIESNYKAVKYPIFFITLMCVFISIFSYIGVRNYYIEAWRNKKIIEEVEYTYHRIDGKDVVVDSAYIYINNPNKK